MLAIGLLLVGSHLFLSALSKDLVLETAGPFSEAICMYIVLKVTLRFGL